jgi:hypothetical protein
MRAVLLALGCLLAGAATAQEMTVPPSAAERCLKLTVEAATAAPEYPFEPFKHGKEGRVKVALSFGTPDGPPDVTILESEGDKQFVESVRGHVEHYRVPCVERGGPPARLVFDYVFKPDDRMAYSGAPVDADDSAKRAMIACIRPAGRQDKPTYPTLAALQGLQGRVWATMSFEAADRPPVVKTYGRKSARVLRAAVESWAEDLRMPCHHGAPVLSEVVYVYVLDDGAYGFKPGVDLRVMLGAMSPAHRAGLPADTTAMGCPFDVSLRYLQPELPNLVKQIGSYNAARQLVLEWLERANLELPSTIIDSIYGDAVTFQIPCLKIDPNHTTKE